MPDQPTLLQSSGRDSWRNIGVLGFATALITAGIGTIFVGQPFDRGAAGVTLAASPAVVFEEPTDKRLNESIESPVIAIPEAAISAAPPDHAAFDVMVDLAMQDVLGISVFDDDLRPFLPAGTSSGPAALADVESLLYSSFAGDPVGPEVFEQGPVLPLTGVSITLLDGDGAGATPRSIFDRYSGLTDVGFAPTATSAAPGEDMLLVGFRVDADLTDPGVCGGNLLNLVVNLHNTDFGDPYQANPSFPGEFYAGGNVFFNFSLVDCAPQSFVDAFIGGEIVNGLADSSAAMFTVRDGATYGAVIVSGENMSPDGSASLIFFEHPDGENFRLENTRYQSYPPMFGSPVPLADAGQTSLDDFGLVPAPPARSMLDPRLTVAGVQLVRDGAGRMWSETTFDERWGPAPPNELFSHWVQVIIDADGALSGTSEEWHDSVKTLLSIDDDGEFPPAFFVTAEGSLVADTGLDVGEQASISLIIDTASWRDGADPDGRADSHHEIDLGSVALPEFEPTNLGGGFVYDLSSGTLIPAAPTASETPDGVEAASAVDPAPTTAPGDPDQTRVGLVAAGAAMTALGAGLLAGATQPAAKPTPGFGGTAPLSSTPAAPSRPGKTVVAAALPPKVGVGARIRGR